VPPIVSEIVARTRNQFMPDRLAREAGLGLPTASRLLEATSAVAAARVRLRADQRRRCIDRLEPRRTWPWLLDLIVADGQGARATDGRCPVTTTSEAVCRCSYCAARCWIDSR
jgi:hypothetical protein